MKSIIFIENIEEAEFIVENKLKTTVLSKCEFVSLSPNILVFLQRHGIKSQCSSKLLNEDFFHEIMDKYQEIYSPIFNKLKSDANLLAPPFYVKTLFYYFRQICMHFLWNIQLIDRFFVNKNYKVAYGFVYPFVKTESPWIEDNQLFIGELLRMYCSDKNIGLKN